MGKSSALLIASAISLAATGVVKAADMLPPAPRIESPREEPEEFAGWYLRGDVGIGFDRNAKLRSTPNPLTQGGAGFIPTAYTISEAAIGATPFIGLGVGYRFNNWFRTDFTMEYRSASFGAYDQLVWNNGAGGQNVLRNFYRGNLSSLVAMFNGYVDLGTWHGLTPFIGVGVGVASSRFRGLTDNGYNNLFAGPGAPANSVTSGVYAVKNSRSFAWALMAGLAYQVNSRLTMEMGYRYLNIGKVRSASPRCAAPGPGFQACANIALEVGRSGTHDLRFGMRWNLSEPPRPMPVAQPIVRKY